MYPLLLENDYDFSLLDVAPVVYVSDIDETYLRTRFRTPLEMFETAIQFAIDKVAYPDMSRFFRLVKRDRGRVLYFLSASPLQMRGVLRRKFLLDEVPCDGLILRDVGRLLVRGAWREVGNPLGYKIYALLTLIARLPIGSRLVLLGDDTQRDAEAYGALSAYFEGTHDLAALRRLLAAERISAAHIDGITRAATDLSPEGFSIEAIFIRKTKGGDLPTGKGVHPFTHPMEILDVLVEKGLLSPERRDEFEARGSSGRPEEKPHCATEP